MKLGGILRILALGCVLASTPLACLKYPWMPATVKEFVELQHDPYPWGTESYHSDRGRRLERVKVALLLYALGTASFCGLCVLVAKTLPWWAAVATWAMVGVTGIGIVLFERPSMGPGTDSAYMVMTIYAPLGIAAVSAVAVLLTVMLGHPWKGAAEQ